MLDFFLWDWVMSPSDPPPAPSTVPPKLAVTASDCAWCYDVQWTDQPCSMCAAAGFPPPDEAHHWRGGPSAPSKPKIYSPPEMDGLPPVWSPELEKIYEDIVSREDDGLPVLDENGTVNPPGTNGFTTKDKDDAGKALAVAAAAKQNRTRSLWVAGGVLAVGAAVLLLGGRR